MQNKKYICHFFIAAVLLLITACSSPINRSTRFKKTPQEYTLNYCGDRIKAPVTDYNKEVWIVYSDRDANPTFHNPGGKVKLKEATFLEPFLVINENGDYLSLVKYDPEIVDQTLTNTKIKDRKKAQYYGWVHKSNLILSRQSVTDISTGFKNKAISIISDTTAVLQSDVFIKRDSVQTFKDEALTIENLKIPLYEVLYILKTSGDHKKSLIARNTSIPHDMPETTILGWVPSSLVKNIGQRLHVDLQTLSADSLSFLKASNYYYDSLYVNNEDLEESMIFSEEEIALRHAPITSYGKDSNGNTVLRTGIPANVGDPNSYYVFNVNGNKVSYGQFREWRKALKRLNIVFVFEGRKQVINSYTKLVNVIQNLQPLFEDENDTFQYRFGSVMAFQGNGGGILPPTIKSSGLTNSYSELVGFLNDEADRMADYNPLPLKDTWSGLRRAVDLVNKNAGKDETNLLIVIGESGNSENIDSTLVNRIVDANCRILGFQLYGEGNNTGNNFVLQMTDLIRYYADKGSIRKREKIVYTDQVTPQNTFRESKKNIYALDYPENSMTQGWILFPEKNTDLPMNNLASCVDTLITEVKADNDLIINSLNDAFHNIGKYRAQYNPLWIRYYKMDDWYYGKNTNIDARSPMWYLPTQPVTVSKYDNEKVNYSLLVSEVELNELMEFLGDLCANEVDYKYQGKKQKARKLCNCPDDELYVASEPEIDNTKAREYMSTGGIRSKLQGLYINKLKYCKLCKLSTGEVKKLTLAEAHLKATGCPTVTPVLMQYQVKDIKNKKRISDVQLDELITYFKTKKENLQKLLTNKQVLKFESNGETYYWIEQEMLP